jgi:hypothetical protein
VFLLEDRVADVVVRRLERDARVDAAGLLQLLDVTLLGHVGHEDHVERQPDLLRVLLAELVEPVLPDRLKMSSRKWTNFRLYFALDRLDLGDDVVTERLRTYFALTSCCRPSSSARGGSRRSTFIGQPRCVTNTLRSESR